MCLAYISHWCKCLQKAMSCWWRCCRENDAFETNNSKYVVIIMSVVIAGTRIIFTDKKLIKIKKSLIFQTITVDWPLKEQSFFKVSARSTIPRLISGIVYSVQWYYLSYKYSTIFFGNALQKNSNQSSGSALIFEFVETVSFAFPDRTPRRSRPRTTWRLPE